MNTAAVQRWVLTSHERTAVTQTCCEMAGSASVDDSEERVVKEMGKARLSKDEEDVRKVQSTLKTWMNPFSQPEPAEIRHLVSGVTADEHEERDLLTAQRKGSPDGIHPETPCQQ